MKPTAFSPTRGTACLCGLLLGALPVAGAVPSVGELEALDLTELSPWTWSGSVRAAGGYKDNVELSAFAPVGSAFARAEAEFFGWRLPEEGESEVQLFGAATLTRYTERTSGQSEAQWFGRAEVSRVVASGWSVTGSLEGFQLDQFLDLSATEAERFAAKLQATGGSAAVALRREAGRGVWFEVRPSCKRETYRDGIADAWQPAAKATLGRRWAEGRGEISLGWQAERHDFDDRRQFSLRGFAMPDTALEFRRQEADLRFTWQAGPERKWRWVSVLIGQRNRDNGPGYFDYEYTALKQEIHWRGAAWRARITGRIGRYDYSHRPVSTALGAPVWRKDEQLVECRLERRLGPGWVVFAEYSGERSDATNPNASFRVNTAWLGVEWMR